MAVLLAEGSTHSLTRPELSVQGGHELSFTPPFQNVEVLRACQFIFFLRPLKRLLKLLVISGTD